MEKRDLLLTPLPKSLYSILIRRGLLDLSQSFFLKLFRFCSLQRVQARRSTLMGKGVTGLAPAAKVVVTRKVATSAMAKVLAPDLLFLCMDAPVKALFARMPLLPVKQTHSCART
jgi:hypothetical protein